MSIEESTEARVKCPACAELILPDAKLCRFCGTKLEAKSPKPRRWPYVVGAIAAVFAIMVMIGSSADYQASETKMHEANILYAGGLTDSQLDSYADQIAAAANVSHSEASTMVVTLLRDHIAPGAWVSTAQASASMAKLENDGVLQTH